MSEEIKNANESVELSDDKLEDVAGGCGDMHYDKKKDRGYGGKKDHDYKPDYKGGHGHEDKYKHGGKY
ncbi:MAG: hypothetical protein ACRC2R_15350 [Xenococcaceae cyanobacterium]